MRKGRPMIMLKTPRAWFAATLLVFSVGHSPASAQGPSVDRVLPLPMAAPETLGIVAPAQACSDLLRVDLSGVAGPGSRVVTAAEGSNDGVPVCAVEGVLAPTIGFKLLLPTQTWTQRYLQVGCGGLCAASRSISGRPKDAHLSRPAGSQLPRPTWGIRAWAASSEAIRKSARISRIAPSI